MNGNILTNLITLVPPGRESAGRTQHNGPCEICGGGSPAGDDRLVVWKNGGDYTAPSGEVFGPIGTFFCRRCGAKGDALDYLRLAHGLSFPDALRRLGIDVSDDDIAEARAERATAEAARAQQEALRLQRLRHEFFRSDEVQRAELLAGDIARQVQDLQTRYVEDSLRSALDAVEAVLTDEQKVRTATARLTMREAAGELCERARLNHLHPITAEGLA